MSAVFRIQGVDIAGVVINDYGYADLVKNSERNAQGFVRFNMVRRNVRTLSCELFFLTAPEMQKLIDAYERDDIFNITFFDPGTLQIVTKEFYRGDRTMRVLGKDIDTMRFSVKVDFVER